MRDVIRHIVVCGKVQGVGYRAWLAGEAMASDLAGWVRNRKDGAVEAVLSGPEAVVAALIEKCRNGPVMARVTSIDNEPADDNSLNSSPRAEVFSILPMV